MKDAAKRQAASNPILFKASAEFTSRPAFFKDLTCDATELSHIVGKYSFSKENELQCGLNNCHHWHQIGYVLVTIDGRETNCGQDCGAREFKVVWDELETELNRQVDEITRRELIAKLITDKDQIISRAQLLESEARVRSKKIGEVIKVISSDPALLREFHASVKVGGSIRVKAEKAKGMGAAFARSGANEDFATIATITGIYAVQRYGSVLNDLRRNVIDVVESLATDRVAQMDRQALEKTSKSLGDLAPTIANAVQFISSADQFLTKQNYENIMQLRSALSRKYQTGRVDKVLKRVGEMLT